MRKEHWHQRGCPLIGTSDPATMRLVDDALVWVCCGGPAEGDRDGGEDDIHAWDFHRVQLLAEVRNVEHPAARLADRAEQARKLEGWVTAAMRIDHAETRASVLDSLTAHIARTGQVP